MIAVPSGARLLADVTALPPSQRLARLQQLGRVEPLLLAMGDEVERLATAEVMRAVAAGELIVGLADEGGTPVTRARARRAHAQALAHAGRFSEALPLCDEAARIADDAGQSIEAARASLASLHALASLTRFDEAIAAGEAAREAFLAGGEPALAGRADINLGATHQMRDEPHSALLHFDRARAALADDPIIIAQLEVNRGNALLSLDDFAAAEWAFGAAAPVFEAHDLGWAAAITEGNLAYLATRQGRLERALFHFERARRYLERDDAGPDLARLLAEQADAFAILGLLEEARTAYERVLPELGEAGMVFETAHAQAGLGRMLLRLGQRIDAASCLASAASAFQTLGHTAAQARVDLIRAELAAEENRLDEARVLAMEALNLVRDRPAEAAAARYQLARLAFFARDFKNAEREVERALRAAESLELAPLLADLLHLRGLLHRAQGRPDFAIADLRAAVGHVERVRGTLQAEQFRAAFLGNRLAIYSDLVVEALGSSGPEALAEAFATVERAKGRALLDMVSGALDVVETTDINQQDSAEAALMADMARLRAEVNWRYSRLTLEDSSETLSTDVAGGQPGIRDLEHELDALQNRIAVTQGMAGLYAPPIDLAAAQRMVPPGTALIEYFLAGEELVAFVIQHDRAQVFRGMANTRDLAHHLRGVRFQVDRAIIGGTWKNSRASRLVNDARKELGALDAVLLAPLRETLRDVQRLVIIPHGPLHTLPFNALWDGENYLIERFEVVYAPSASLLAHLRRGADSRPSSGRALVVGVPDGIAPNIAIETQRVAAALGTEQVLMGPDATAQRVVAAAEGASVIHLACHGRFVPESPLMSGIKLSDRWLTVRDNYQMCLQSALVTLSGCNTGRNVVQSGDELVGLARSLLAAGASALLVSLWTVNDESTADLMTDFYRAWRNGATPFAALREAQCAQLARRPHPAFWAPFILEGNP